jgi:hypothetical protein
MLLSQLPTLVAGQRMNANVMLPLERAALIFHTVYSARIQCNELTCLYWSDLHAQFKPQSKEYYIASMWLDSELMSFYMKKPPVKTRKTLFLQGSNVCVIRIRFLYT